MRYSVCKGAHSVYSIQFHYVAVVKYRRKVITEAVGRRIMEINEEVAKSFGIRIIEQNTDRDHIHVLFESKPQIKVSSFINSIKSVSSRLIRKEFPEVKQKLWKGHFWSPSYFLASTGQVTLETLKRYVQNQGE